MMVKFMDSYLPTKPNTEDLWVYTDRLSICGINLKNNDANFQRYVIPYLLLRIDSYSASNFLYRYKDLFPNSLKILEEKLTQC